MFYPGLLLPLSNIVVQRCVPVCCCSEVCSGVLCTYVVGLACLCPGKLSPCSGEPSAVIVHAYCCPDLLLFTSAVVQVYCFPLLLLRCLGLLRSGPLLSGSVLSGSVVFR